MRKRGVVVSFFVLCAGCVTIPTQDSSPSRPPVKGIWEITADRTGNIWFVEIITNKIGKLDPKSGTVEKYDLPSGVHPRGLTIDKNGVIWTTTSEPGGVLRFDPTTKETRLFGLPQGNQFVSSITVDQKETVWFTVAIPGRIGRLDVATSTISLYDIPSTPSLPEDIVVDKGGRVWFTEQAAHKLGRFDPDTLQFEEYRLPLKIAMPGRMAIHERGTIWFVGGPMGEFLFTFDPEGKKFIMDSRGDQDLMDVAVDRAGAVWFTDSESGALKRLDSGTGQVEAFPTPVRGGGPHGITIDPESNIYFVEYRQNKIVKFISGSQTFVEFDIP